MANIPVVDSNPLASQTFFNGYFSQPIQVSDAVWGQVYGYFFNLTKSSEAANSLAQSVISLTYNNNLDPLAMLDQFTKAPNSNSVKTLLISFFNSTKGATSKLGYKKLNETPINVVRNIIP